MPRVPPRPYYLPSCVLLLFLVPEFFSSEVEDWLVKLASARDHGPRAGGDTSLSFYLFFFIPSATRPLSLFYRTPLFIC